MGSSQYGIIFSLIALSTILPIMLSTVIGVTDSNGQVINPPYCSFGDPSLGLSLSSDPNCIGVTSSPTATNSIADCQKINFQSTDCSNLQLTVANGKATCGAGFLSGAIAGEAAGLSQGSPIGLIVGLFGGALTGAGIGCGVLPAGSPALTNAVGSAINSVPVLGDFSKAISYMVTFMFDFLKFVAAIATWELALVQQLPAIGVIIFFFQIMTVIMLGYTGLRLGRGGG